MNDIRINLNFRSNPKVKKLIRKLGEGAGLSLVTLWCYTGAHYPKGNFNGMDADDIEEAAMWTGEKGAFLTGLLSGGLLESSPDGSYSIHDWKEHQRYVYFHPERKAQSQRANEARWQRKRGVNPKRNPVRTPKRNPPLPPPPPKEGEEDQGTGPVVGAVPRSSQTAKCTTPECRRIPTVSESGRWYCRTCAKKLSPQGGHSLAV